MKKPDQFQREVKKVGRRFWQRPELEVTESQVVNLLRREHAWMVRMVKRLQNEERIEGASVVGYRVALKQVSDQLAKRRK